MISVIAVILLYFVYLVFWLVVNTIGYFLSVLLKTRRVVLFLSGIALVIAYLFNFIVGIGLLIYTISLLLNGQLFLFILMIFAGFGILSVLFTYLQIPFIMISSYFSEKIVTIDFTEKIATAEILDENNKVIAKIEGDTTISVRVAKYFMLFYFMNLLFIFLVPEDRNNTSVLGWISQPFFQIISGTLIFGMPYTFYHKIRYHLWMPIDKRYFFIQVWKINLFLLLPIGIVLYILALIVSVV